MHLPCDVAHDRDPCPADALLLTAVFVIVPQICQVLSTWCEGISRGSITALAQQRMYNELAGPRGDKPWKLLPGAHVLSIAQGRQGCATYLPHGKMRLTLYSISSPDAACRLRESLRGAQHACLEGLDPGKQ